MMPTPCSRHLVAVSVAGPDPAHIPFAHHGVILSRAMGTPMGIVMDEEEEQGIVRTTVGGPMILLRVNIIVCSSITVYIR